MFQRIKVAIRHYDPYAFMQVSAMQCMVVTIVLFFVNFFFAPFAFDSALQLPVVGIIACATEKNFNLRMRNTFIYCILCIIYSFILSSIIEYRTLTVFAVGGIVFGLFMLCKNKYPYLWGIVVLMQVVIYTQMRINYGSNYYILLNYGVSFALATAIGLGVMYFYPRVYFYRVWLRTVSATLREFAYNFEQIAHGEIDHNSLMFNNFYQMYDFTLSLGKREHGFRARKLALRITVIYSHLIVLSNNAVDNQKLLLELAESCWQLAKAVETEQAAVINAIDQPEKLNQDLQVTIINVEHLFSLWNRSCLRV